MTEYTEDDKRYGKEYQDVRYQHRLINEELSEYSWKTIREFDWFLRSAIPQESYLLEVSCKEYIDEQNNISIKFAEDPYLGFIEEIWSTEHIHIISFEDFWYRWNKFKKLKVFL